MEEFIEILRALEEFITNLKKKYDLTNYEFKLTDTNNKNCVILNRKRG